MKAMESALIYLFQRQGEAELPPDIAVGMTVIFNRLCLVSDSIKTVTSGGGLQPPRRFKTATKLLKTWTYCDNLRRFGNHK
ncbi:hypothetical protein Ahy_A09g044912 isoform C [Arachis hypogaea]|uniref:Uncharacterized protein n=1 Tax=Arachis hypogaea TaxID=3818 RepID=A0A445BL27_ARAHY|nr:hypothetical protein Ahy_A09g044912 isoform C [Arachis hypogaea]